MKKFFNISLFIILVFLTNQSIFAQIPDFLTAPRTSAIDPDRRNGCDYLIITPNNDAIKALADTLRNFREEQGIITRVMTLREACDNHPDSIRAFLRRGYENWSPCPAAVLLLGDYAADPAQGILSYALTDHPDGSAYEPYMADNKIADFNNDGLPDIVIARMPAADGEEAQRMVQKTLDYERHPYTDPYYYAHPVTAMGYQRSRWFQLCTEIIAGYLEDNGKDVIHINGIHQGTPDSVWSTGQHTQQVLDYFGPEGLGYIPATMSYLTDWNGNSSHITRALENGSYLMIHRDHGTFTSWSEPNYNTWYIDHLNNDKLTFIMSANCQTGDFSYGTDSTDCLAERFLRVPKGAVGVIAASQLSYSYVNDTYVWGFFDYLYPDFLPDYGAQQIDFQYPAFANAYGKYYLAQSSLPANASMKPITYNLFHYFGDAYLQLYSEVPQQIAISHPEYIRPGNQYVTIHADEGAFVALSFDNQLIARGKSDGSPMTLHFTTLLHDGDVIKVVATKQNHFRHESYITVNVTAGISDVADDFYEIYPNPVVDILHLDVKTLCTSSPIIIEIYDITGCKILVSTQTEINVSNLPAGVYFIKISGNETIVKRFIKK